MYIYGVFALLNFIIYTQYAIYTYHCNPSAIAPIYTIIPLPIKLITQHILASRTCNFTLKIPTVTKRLSWLIVPEGELGISWNVPSCADDHHIANIGAVTVGSARVVDV
jgi:hypothetical protein